VLIPWEGGGIYVGEGAEGGRLNGKKFQGKGKINHKMLSWGGKG